ncbi:MAG: hypothetical protein ABW042_01885, partial [Phenylobacterium sp.]
MGAGDEGAAGPAPRRGLFERLRAARLPAVATLALVIAGFGGGVVAANVFGGGHASGPAGAEAERGEVWSLFGKPRSADAKRGGPKKPEGFAIWRTRVDSTGAEPRACIEMSRALDPARS